QGYGWNPIRVPWWPASLEVECWAQRSTLTSILDARWRGHLPDDRNNISDARHGFGTPLVASNPRHGERHSIHLQHSTWENSMRFVMRACRSTVFGLATLGLAAAPAFAQWTRGTDIPAIPLFSIFTKGDTIVAGADTAVYLSTNGGVTWSRTAK